MQSTYSRFAHLSAAILFVGLVAGCSDDPATPIIPEIAPSEASILLEVGETRDITILRVPSNAAFSALSEDILVATVTQTASAVRIRGVCTGFVTIALTMPAYPGVESQITVEVFDDSVVGPVDCSNPS